MRQIFRTPLLTATTLAVLASPAFAQDPYATAPAYATPLDSRLAIAPIVTTGQQVPQVGDPTQSFLFRGIPDGMGLRTDRRAVRLLVNHEFRNNTGTPFGTLPNGARVSELTLGAAWSRQGPALKPTAGQYEFTSIFDGMTLAEIPAPPRGLSRLCSAFLADERVGFDRPIFLHGEENAPPLTFDGQGGIAIADIGGKAYTMPWMGHAEWENVIVAPGTGRKTVVFLNEDGAALTSQLYMWVGEKHYGASDPLLRNGLKDGQLYVLAGSDAAANSEATFTARGAKTDVRWVAIDPGQTDVDLEAAAQQAGAFGFVRVEDGAADKRQAGLFYFVTTGSPGSVNPFGRLYRLAFNPARPAGPARLSILLDGSEGMVSPDNIDTNRQGELVICEDPNYDLAKDLGLTRDTSLWRYDLKTGRLSRIAQLDRAAALAHALGANAGNSASTIGTPGGWEFSGVIDAEDLLGRGAWIVNVQAHSLRIAPTAETVEGGQILQITTKSGDRH